MEKKRRDLRHQPIMVELDGEVKEYASITDFCNEEGFAYHTVLQWMHGLHKPCIDIKITKLEKR